MWIEVYGEVEHSCMKWPEAPRDLSIWVDIPRCSMQSQPSRAACDDCDFAIEGKDVLEVIELNLSFCFGFGGHLGSVKGHRIKSKGKESIEAIESGQGREVGEIIVDSRARVRLRMTLDEGCRGSNWWGKGPAILDLFVLRRA